MPVKPIPDGYHYRDTGPNRSRGGEADRVSEAGVRCEGDLSSGRFWDGSVMHAEVKIGDLMAMVGEATDQWKPIQVTVALYVEDSDAWYKRALRAGAASVREPSDQFYGDRSAGVKDFAGNQWWIHTHIEDVTPEEIKKRAEVWMKQQKCG